MATWKIKMGTETTGSGTKLKDCKILQTYNPSTQVYTYTLIDAGGGNGPSNNNNPMSFSNVTFNGQSWSSIASSTTPNVNAPKDTVWSGSCSTLGAAPTADPGTWSTEATGGFPGKGKGKKSAKSVKRTKSAKGTSKKAVKGTKTTSKKAAKSTKGTSKKAAKSAKATKSTKSTKSAKRTSKKAAKGAKSRRG